MIENHQRFGGMSAGISIIAMLLSTASPAMAQDTATLEELKKLKSQAEAAVVSAKAALKMAQDAEKDVDEALKRRGNPPEPKITYDLARLDCYDGAKGKGSNCPSPGNGKKEDLTFYASFDPKNQSKESPPYSDSAESKLQARINSKEKSDKLSFQRKDLPITSRISTSTGEKAIGLDYAIPLTRKRIVSANRENITPVNDTLIVGVSAAFDGDNKKAGLIARAGKFNDSPITASVTWSRSYHKKLKLHGVPEKAGKEESFAARGMNLADKLISQCKAALSAPAPVFGASPSKPTACEGDQLLEWAFDPDGANFKDNVAAYNKAFWEPSDDSIPRRGLGFKATVGTQNFKYIPTSVFAPQGYVPNKDPIFVSTLNTDDLTTPNLGQQVQREWSFEGTAFIFGHVPIKNSIFEGFTVRPSVTLARRWEVASDFASKQFCRITVSPVTECKTFNIAAPEAYEAIEPSLNFRTKLGFAKGNAWTRRYVPSIGLSPTISYSSHESRTRLAVPAFLAVDKDGKFSGGVQYAREWGNTDKTKNVSVWSIFIGTNFSLDGSQE
ncbi:hypothetical protein [Novosphingobium sp. 28-62-57]|nr:hypothetical protein [Novosphingobium sp. 28-62-57]